MEIPKLTSQRAFRKWVREASRELIVGNDIEIANQQKLALERRFSSEAKYTIKMVIRNQNRLNQDKTSYDVILVTGIATIALADLNDAILFA